jgi:predicted dehydrogenase
MVNELSFGMIGYSPGNGHPFSFSAIINGYDGGLIRQAGWDVIADYLDQQDRHDIGLPGVRVTDCWAEEADIASQLAKACGIEKFTPPAEMLDLSLNGIIIARDDWESHHGLAMPFLEAGIPVFIDKPLTMSRMELEDFKPYLQSGLLMSCSAFRYARELDGLRARPDLVGELQLINANTPLSMSRYGIHQLEAVQAVLGARVQPVMATTANGTAHSVLRFDDVIMTLHSLGKTAKRFRLSFFGTEGQVEVDITDNFTAFRRCLLSFVDQVRTRKPAIPPRETTDIIEALIAIEGQMQACSTSENV